jgi:hypothetical protein
MPSRAVPESTVTTSGLGDLDAGVQLDGHPIRQTTKSNLKRAVPVGALASLSQLYQRSRLSSCPFFSFRPGEQPE